MRDNASAVFKGPVAQLNRASDSGSEGRGFESLLGHFSTLLCITIAIFLIYY